MQRQISPLGMQRQISPPSANADVRLHMFWAFLAGVSIPLGTANHAILNTRSDHPKYQSFYTTLLSTVLGGIAVVPLACTSPSLVKAPCKLWSLLGGLCSIPAFGVLIAAPDLGIQISLLILVGAQLLMTLVLDHLDGRMLLSSPIQLLGLGCVFCGILTDSQAGPHFSHHQPRLLSAVEESFPTHVLVRDIVLSALCGIGYTLQAKCNNTLAKDVGSGAGATSVSSAVNLFASLPIAWFLCISMNRWPTFLLSDWPRFAFGAVQSAFYIGCLSVVPSRIGYTASFMSVQLGSLLVSSIVDASGVLGNYVPFTMWRASGLTFVVVGLWLFSSQSKSPSEALDDNSERQRKDLEEKEGLTQEGPTHHAVEDERVLCILVSSIKRMIIH